AREGHLGRHVAEPPSSTNWACGGFIRPSCRSGFPGRPGRSLPPERARVHRDLRAGNLFHSCHISVRFEAKVRPMSRTLLVFAARHLGRTIARELAGDGWNTAAFARSEKTIASFREELPEALGFVGD